MMVQIIHTNLGQRKNKETKLKNKQYSQVNLKFHQRLLILIAIYYHKLKKQYITNKKLTMKAILIKI